MAPNEQLPQNPPKSTPTPSLEAEKTTVDQLKQDLHQALESKESGERLTKIGDLMYENFKSPEYSAEQVLTSIAEVYREHKRQFDPRLTFVDFIKSFGTGMVKLCQQKLVDEGGYDLGKYGENEDGVDGKYGRLTNGALRSFFQKLHPDKKSQEAEAHEGGDSSNETSQQTASTDEAAPQPSEGNEASPPAVPVTEQTVETPDNPIRTPEKLTVSPKNRIERRILDIYGQTDNAYRTVDMPNYFGRTPESVNRYISNIDPVTEKPFTFLNRPIATPQKQKSKKGINLEMMVFLKIVEEKLEAKGINYLPKALAIGGSEFRGMKIGGKETSTLSSHAFGMAIDIDPGNNGPKNGRGNIPDQFALTMVECGFAWGLVGERKDYPKLGIDPMHFQPRFPLASPDGQALLATSPIGRKYWTVIKPLLDQV